MRKAASKGHKLVFVHRLDPPEGPGGAKDSESQEAAWDRCALPASSRVLDAVH
jgi:hypothetical protein